MKSSTATALAAFAAAAYSSSTYAAPISEPVPSVNPLAPAPPPSTGNTSAPAPAPVSAGPPMNPFSGGPPSGPPSSHGSFGPPPPPSSLPPSFSPPSSSSSSSNILEDANIMQGIRTGIKEGLKVTLSQTLNVPSTDDLVKESEVTQVINCIGAEPLNAMISCMRDQHLSSSGADTSPFPSVHAEDLLDCIDPTALNRMEYCVSKVQVQRLAQDAHIFQQMYNGANLKAQEFAMNYPFLPQPGQEPETELEKATKPLFDTHWVDAHKELHSLKAPTGPGASFGGPIGLPKGYDDDLLAGMPPPPPPSSASKGPVGPPGPPGDDDEDFDEEDFLSKLPPPSSAKGPAGAKGDEDFDDEEFLSKLPPSTSSKGPSNTKVDDKDAKTPSTTKGPADADVKDDDEFDEEDFLSKLPPPSSAKGTAGSKGDAEVDDADFDEDDFLSKLPSPPSSKGPSEPTKAGADDKEDPLAKLAPSSFSDGPSSDSKDADDDFLKSLHLPAAGNDDNKTPADASSDATVSSDATCDKDDKKDADALGDFEDDDEDSYLYDDENDYLLPPYDDKPSNATATADPKLDVKTDGAKPTLAPLPPFDPKELAKLKDAPAPPLAKRKYGYGPDWETALGVRDGHPLPRRR